MKEPYQYGTEGQTYSSGILGTLLSFSSIMR